MMSYSGYRYGYLTFDGFWNGQPVKVTELPKEYKGQAYALMMQYPKSFISHLDSGKKWTDYYGNRYAEYFPIDIDHKEDLDRTKELTISLLQSISNESGIDLAWVLIFFSGFKGFHILIPSILFDISPHKNLESKFKLLAKRLISGHPIEKVKSVDLPFYSRNRWFRLPNSINPNSNLYKIQLTWNELTTLTMNEIQELAKAPRYLDPVIPPSELTPVPILAQMYQGCLETATLSSSIDVEPLIAKGVEEGNRGNTAFTIIKALRDQGCTKEEIQPQIEDWNKLNRPPIKKGGWPDSQIKSTLKFEANPILKRGSPRLRALLRNDPIFRTTLLSDAEHRCVITILSITNDSEKVWEGITIRPGQFITSQFSLGENAHPTSVDNPEAAARRTINKLKKKGVLIKVEQLKNNKGNLYEWKGKFAEVFQYAENHPCKSPPQITPVTRVERFVSVNYDDALQKLITPIDHLFMSSTKSFPPLLPPNTEIIN